MLKIEPPKITRLLTYECPECGGVMHKVENCNAHVCDTCQLFFINENSYGMFETNYAPILEEATKHKNHKMLELEMNCFGFTRELLEEYGIGYLPFGYWAWRETDCKYGTLTFPMKNWKGQISNILGKCIGSDEKLNLAYAIHKLDPRAFGVFNMEAFWNQEVHVYSNPTDCLQALQNGQKNSACVFGSFMMPEIFAPQKIYVHTVLPMNDFLDKVKTKVAVAG